MGKGRTKRKRKAEKLVVNKQAHQARLEKLDKIKALSAPASKTGSGSSAGGSKAKGGKEALAAAPRKKKGKAGKKTADDDEDEDEEDIETILARFKKEHEDAVKVTEEVNVPPPSPRAHMTLTANPLNASELILFGGEHYNGRRCTFYNELFRYNTDKHEWRRISSPTSPGPRSAHQAVATPTGQLYVFGGEFASASENQFFHYKDFWALDLTSNQWQKLDVDLRPSPRSGHRMVLWKTFLVLFGGFYDTLRETRYHDDLWFFDLSEMKWVKAVLPENSAKPSARSGCQLFVVNDVLYLYGGYCKVFNKGEKAKGIIHSDFWSMKLTVDLKGLRWERRKRSPFMPSARSGMAVAVHKTRAIFFGGVFDEDVSDERMVSTFYNDFLQFQTESARWYPLTLRAPKKPGGGRKRGGKKSAVAPAPASNGDASDDDDAVGAAGRGGRGTATEDDGNRDETDGDDGDQDNDNDDDLDDDDDDPRSRGPSQSRPSGRGALSSTASTQAPAPAPVVNDKETTPADAVAVTVTAEAPFYPAARFNTAMAIQRNVLYLYGGLVEVDDREITLCDMYALNLDRLDKFEVLQSQPTEDGWDASASEDDDDDDDDDDDEDEDDEDEDDDEDGGDEDSNNEGVTKNAAGPPNAMNGVVDGVAGEALPSAAVVTGSSMALAESAAPNAAAATAAVTAAAAEGAWDDDGFEPATLVSTTTAGMTAGASGTASNVKSSAGGRERREALKAQLRVTNAEAVPKVDEALAEFYARTSAHWTREAFARDQQHVGKALRRTGFELAKEAYETMQPILKQMKELDLLLSDDEDAAAGPAGGKRKDGGAAAKGGASPATGGARSRR